MDWNSGWVATALLAAGTAICYIGGVIVFMALFRDRSRGRRRCPRCWYDMAGAPALTCPECGRVSRKEKSLQRTRRFWKRAMAGAAIMLFGLSTIAAPKVMHKGWMSFVPMGVLVWFAPGPRDGYVWDAAAGEHVLHGVAAEIQRRRSKGATFRDWEWRVLLERSAILQARRTWLADTELALWPRIPDWLLVDSIVVKDMDTGDRLDEIRSQPIWSRGGGTLRWLRGGVLSRGALYKEYKVELVLDGPQPLLGGIPTLATIGRTKGVAGVIFQGTIRVPVKAVTSPDEVIVPDRSPEIDALIRQNLRALVGGPELTHGAPSGLSLWLLLPFDAMKEHEDLGVSFIVELLRNETPVETWAFVMWPPYRGGAWVFDDTSLWVSTPLRLLPIREAHDPVAQNLWSIRVRGESTRLVKFFDTERYWAGEIVFPLKDLLEAGKKESLNGLTP